MSNTTETKSRSRFFSGVVALTAANLFVKVVGLILKIPLRGLLTDSGMFYYNTAYEIYAWLFTIATTGLPVAVSMMISEDRAKGNTREIRRIFKVTSFLFFIVGTVSTAIMFFGAPLFEKAFKVDGSAYCMMAVAPTLFFICVASALRGYFQGYQRMTPTAVSEVIEAIGKLMLGLLFAHYAIRQGYALPVVAAYAAFGLTIGVAGGMLFLLINKFLFRPESYDIEYASLANESMPVRSAKRIMWTLILIAIPITLANSVMSFSTMLDGMILSRRLQSIGYNEEIVKTMIGNYKSCATPLANLPPALITPITASIIPLMSAAIASGNRERIQRVMDGSLLITAIIELPCALGMSVLSEPIIKLIFGSNSSAEAAAPLLSILSLSVFFISTLSVTSSFLQAHKLERKPIISMLCGAAVKLTASFILISIPQINIYGSPIASCLSCFTISAVNLYFIKKHIGFVPDFKRILIRPFAASVVCALAAMGGYWFFRHFFGHLAVILAILFAAIVYFFVIFLFRAITREDVLLLPKGEKLCRLLSKMKLLK